VLTRLIIFLYYINILNANSQTNKVEINHQKNFKYFWAEVIDSALIKPFSFDTINVELRIWKFTWTDGNHTMLRLVENKEGHWSGVNYEFYFYNDFNRDSSLHLKRQVTIKSTWINDWQLILYKNYLNIKTQKEIDNIYRKKLKEFLSIADGGGLRIEIVTKNNKRSFEYNNAKNYYDFYRENGLEISEYRFFLELEAILYRNFDNLK
jgi:hypothetical protein